VEVVVIDPIWLLSECWMEASKYSIVLMAGGLVSTVEALFKRTPFRTSVQDPASGLRLVLHNDITNLHTKPHSRTWFHADGVLCMLHMLLL